jgi:hypothetical protein
MHRRTGSRGDVKYFAAPSMSGKTAVVLPAFLHGKKWENCGTNPTDYLYLAFDI